MMEILRLHLVIRYGCSCLRGHEENLAQKFVTPAARSPRNWWTIEPIIRTFGLDRLPARAHLFTDGADWTLIRGM
jgi:hypothetical protein